MGKKLEKWLEEKNYYSENASKVNRSLALGGVATIWILRDPEKIPQLDAYLLIPLGFLIFSLFCDLLQYFLGAIIWGNFHRYHEVNTSEDEQSDIGAPIGKSNFISIFFFAKISAMLIAYIVLLSYLFIKFFMP